MMPIVKAVAVSSAVVMLGTAVAASAQKVAPEGEADRAPDATLERFLDHCRKDDRLTDVQQSHLLEKVASLRKRQTPAPSILSEVLADVYPELAQARQDWDQKRYDEAATRLRKLTGSSDLFLAAEAALGLAHVLVGQQNFEAAHPLLERITGEASGYTARRDEALLLRAQAESGLLDSNTAIASYNQFLKDYPQAPPAQRINAERKLTKLNQLKQGSLPHVHQNMLYSRRRLGLGDADAQTQQVQSDIVNMLTEMIEQSEGQGSSPSQGAAAQSGQGQGPGPGGGNVGGTSQGMSSAPQRVIQEDVKRMSWADLRKRQQDPQAFNALKARLPARYRELVEQYYRSLQDDSLQDDGGEG